MSTQNPRQVEELTAVRTFGMRRFTRQEHNRGDTAGWRLEVGWFRRVSGLEWGWFRHEVEDEET